jgi:hypothetical protein
MLFCGSRRIRESAAEAKPTRERNKIPKREIKKDKPSSFFLTGKKKIYYYLQGTKDARFAEASVTGQVAETSSENVQMPQNL